MPSSGYFNFPVRLPLRRPHPKVAQRMDSSSVPSSGVGWLRRVGGRLRALWLEKLIGITTGMALFFTVYFWLLNHTRHAITTVPLIFIDRMVAFEPWAVVLYVSLWPYVTLGPALLTSRRELISFGWASAALSVIGFGTFILWPTAVPKVDFELSIHSSLSLLKTVDASGNAFPSLHVAFAVFTAAWLASLLREMHAGATLRSINWLWCLGIVYSTLAIRQHVALDAISGVVLGAAVAIVHLRIIRPAIPLRPSL
jgi:membrane-associated phospholipid phosphatase